MHRRTRESIASWEGSKGDLLGDILDRRDAIDDSDQGRSFRAFWDFLMSAERQESLDAMLDAAFAMPAIRELRPDRQLRRVHYDWMEAGERTQRTVALLSRQLRRFLDDGVWLENRRIMEILRSIEAKALELRDEPPTGAVTELDEAAIGVALPMERPLFSPPLGSRIDSSAVAAGDEEIDAEALFSQWAVDRDALREFIRRSLDDRDQISLAQLAGLRPLERGLAELLAYLGIASEDPNAVLGEDSSESLSWIDEAGGRREARIPLILFAKESAADAKQRKA